MSYFLLIYVIFLIIVLVNYPKAITTWFLFLMLAGWSLSLTGLLLYVSRMNEYYHIINRYFNISRELWRYLMLAGIDPLNSIRLINLGVLLFVFSLCCFSLKFTNAGKRLKKLYFILLLFPLVELVFYDPFVNKTFYLYLFDRVVPLLSFEQYNALLNAIYSVTSFVNKFYVITAIFNLLYYLFCRPKISFIRNYVLLVIICITPVSIIHTIMFSWAPRILVNISTLTNYIGYLNLEALILRKEYSHWFQMIITASFAIIVAAILRFNVIEYYFKQKDIHIIRSINTANLGVNVFSHAIKNRLVSILAEAEEIVHSGKADGKILDSANNIIRVCHESIYSMNDLNSKLKIKKLDFKPTSIFVPVEKALSAIKATSPEIKIIMEHSDTAPVCFLDERHMTEVVINLINNSIESMDNKQGFIKVGVEREENWGVISVSDTGCGITRENIKRVFDPFFSTKSTRKNWGVGLSYCYKIISSHGGKLLANSVPNQGATFRIQIPAIS